MLAPCAVGGLRDTVAPGDLVVPDQLVDRTHRRVGSYVEPARCTSRSPTPTARARARHSPRPTRTSRRRHDGGHRGPRFSTRAESRDYAEQGWDLINMTGAPEAQLAREMGQCYARSRW